MKYLIILSTLLFIPAIFAQKSTSKKDEKYTTLWVENKDVILQGTLGLEFASGLFVGQEYTFTIITNNQEFDLEIQSENLTVTLDESSKKSTGGLRFTVAPIKTGKCSIQLSVGKGLKRAASLMSREFYAFAYPMPPVSISNIRTGEIIKELDKNAELSCSYGPGSGIFTSYPIRSWKAKLASQEFSGTGTALSKDLISAVNKASAGDLLLLNVELDENNTGYTTSEAVFILK